MTTEALPKDLGRKPSQGTGMPHRAFLEPLWTHRRQSPHPTRTRLSSSGCLFRGTEGTGSTGWEPAGKPNPSYPSPRKAPNNTTPGGRGTKSERKPTARPRRSLPRGRGDVRNRGRFPAPATTAVPKPPSPSPSPVSCTRRGGRGEGRCNGGEACTGPLRVSRGSREVGEAGPGGGRQETEQERDTERMVG